MNYFAHGRHFVEEPYFLAGTAVPDWLSVVHRRIRVRAKAATPFIHDEDTRVASIAQGIVQHHEDDDWFHRTPAFGELSWDFTVAVRDVLSPDDSMRPSFLGHILVELLLDATLMAEDPAMIDAYYQAIDTVDAGTIATAVNGMANRPADRLAWFIPRFASERFLYDYLDDQRLLFRLNQVMKRVGLPTLPDEFRRILPDARQAVDQRRNELLERHVG